MDKKTAIQSEQLRQMYAASIVPLATSTMLAAILAYMQRNVIDFGIVITWFSVVALVAIARAILAVAYQRSSVNSDESFSAWRVRFRLGTLATGLVWGAAGLLLFPDNSPQNQLFLVFMLAGLTAGGVVSYSADLVSASVFSISALAPLIVHLFGMGDGLYVAMGLAVTLYLSFMIVSLKHINRNTYENIVLRFEAADREDIVRASEERYRLLLSHSPVGIFHYDTHLVITYSNHHFAHILQNDIENIIGLDMNRIKEQAVLPALKKALEGEIAYYEGHYSATFSAANVWIFMTCAPFQDVGGKIFGGIAIVQDITQRKQAEASLRIAATAFEAKEGIMVTDANAFILRVNRAFTDITGYSSDDVIGKKPNILGSGRQDVNFFEEMWKSINIIGTWEGEIWNRRKNGEVFPEYLTISAVKDENDVVTNYVAIFTDITLRKITEEEIKSLAFYDPLTKLPNRRFLQDRLQQALSSRVYENHDAALLLIDLDNFKTLNDTLGHDVGDLLLQQVAQRLLSCVREGDTVARLGGDEFVVMLEQLSSNEQEAAEQTKVIGEKILLSLNQPHHLARHEYQSTSSIGATLFNNGAKTIDDLLKQADIAMYQAKKAGRNALLFFDQQMQDNINKHVAFESQLRKALEKKQFRLYYQIQVDDKNRILGAEALIRWMHLEQNIIQPAQFIPLAEESTLIHDIGQWTLEAACQQLAIWNKNEATQGLSLAINVSAHQFMTTNFVESIEATIQTYGVNPARLTLELTESVILKDVEDIVRKMQRLKSIGIKLSLDDFGTGYSSLSYLKRLPIDQIKIDQSFVRDIAVDASDLVMVKNIIDIAKNFNLKVIAEGVETEEQLKYLKQNGCTAYQGYLFSRPLPINEFDEWMRLHAQNSDSTP